jgi:ectoine hydroxylase-related dioxygenase (phytanoyl-CoA dioxygenase family)
MAEMVLKDKEIQSYNKDGYLVLKNFIEAEYLNDLLSSIRAMAEHIISDSGLNKMNLSDLISKLENEDHKKVYTIQKTMATAMSTNRILSVLNMDSLHHELYDVPLSNIHFHLFQTPFQFPHDSQFDLSWHQESGSYGKNFSKILTCWFPILGSVNQEKGSVEIIPGSHADGYRESKHTVYDSGINDWIVDPNEQEIKKATIVNLEPGDILLFDSDLLHRSVGNKSGDVRVTGIARTIDVCAKNEINVMAVPANFLDHE